MKKKFCFLILIFSTFLILNMFDLTVVNASGNYPTITLNGEQTIFIEVGTQYVDLGAIAYDPEDGFITNKIVIDSHTVNMDVVGRYSVTYSVTDSNNNTALVIRTVFVFDGNITSNNGHNILGSSYSSTTITDIVSLENGGYVGIGQHQTNSYTSYGNIFAINSFGDLSPLNDYITTYSYYSSNNLMNTLTKVIETKDHDYLTIGYNGYYNMSQLSIFDSAGVGTSSPTVSGKYTDIVEYSPNYFAAINGSYLDLYYGVNLLGDYYTGPLTDIATLSDNEIVGYYNDGVNTTVTAYNLSDSYPLWTTVLSNINLVNLFVLGDTVHLVGNQIININGQTNGIIMTLENGNIISQNEFLGNTTQTFIEAAMLNDTYYVLTNSDNSESPLVNGSNGIALISKDFDVIKTLTYDSNLIAKNIATSTNGDIIVGGSYYDSGIYYEHYENIQNILFDGFEDITIDAVPTYDLYADLSVLNVIGETFTFEVNSIEGVFNSSIAGVYHLIYNITIDSVTPQTVYLNRTITVLPVVKGIVDGGTYDGSVVLDIYGVSIEINGNAYHSNDVYTQPGDSHMVLTGYNGAVYTYDFTINLISSGVEDQTIYDHAVTPVFSGGNALLNDKPYVSGTTIDTIGYYELEIIGAQGVVFNFGFSILPTINVTENNRYEGEVIPVVTDVKGSYTLDGIPYIPGTIVDAVGYHTLSILGNSFSQTIHFTIAEQVSTLKDGSIYPYMVQPSISNASLELDGAPYLSGTPIFTVGEHVLKVIGTNGYLNKYTFTISEQVSQLVDGGSYTNHVTPIIPNATLTIDGIAYISGTNYAIPGVHYLMVIGNNYQNLYTFTITMDVQGIEDNAVYTSSVSPIFLSGTATLNGVNYQSGDEIDQIGYYDLVVSSGTYQETFHFSIIPNILTEYYSMVQFNLHAVEMTLDGNPYHNEVIASIGDHTLIVDGKGTFHQTYFFTIYGISGIVDGGHYIGSVRCGVDAQLEASTTLDDTPFTGGVIDSIGNHTLVVTGDNGVIQIQNFVVVESVSNLMKNATYIGQTTPIILNSSLLLDGNVYTSGTEIHEVGNHTLSVLGENGYINDYNFTIQEVVSNLTSGGSYYSVLPIIPNASLQLDGIPYASNTLIQQIGNHTLTVSGANGYLHPYLFTIEPDVRNVENKNLSLSTIISLSDVTLHLNGDLYASGTLIDQIGNYQLTINGVNGYSKTISFTIVPVLNVTDNSSYFENVTPMVNGNGLFTLNGDPFVAGQLLNQVGTYYLDIQGVNYHQIITFTIEPNIQGIQEGGIYDGQISFSVDHVDQMKLNGLDYTNGEVLNKVGNYELDIYGINNYLTTIHFSVKEHLTGVTKISSVPLTPNFTNVVSAQLNGTVFNSDTPIEGAGNYTLTIFGINGYTNTYTFTIEGNANIHMNEQYEGSITLESANGALLINGEPYEIGHTFNTVGHHVLTIVGEEGYTKEIHFTILPSIQGISDGETYQGGVLPNIPHANLSLNGTAIENLQLLTTIGYNHLTITGLGGFEQQLSFTIEPDLTNMESTFSETADFNFPQTLLFIDGEAYQSGDIYRIVGNHTLNIQGINGYEKTMTFVIEPTDAYVIQNENYIGSVVFNIDHANLFIDGQPYTSGEEFVAVGNHHLKVVGSNGYVKVVLFTLVEQNKDLVNGADYSISVTPDLPNCILMLNGTSYKNKHIINSLGTNVLTILGANGYVHTIVFTITDHVPVVEGGSYSAPIVIKKLNATMILNGVEMTKDVTINKQESYTLEITGLGGYSETIHFTYHNYNLEKAGVIAIPIVIVLGIAIFVSKTRSRVV